MPLTSILVAASGGSASNGAIELACRIAAESGAHLENFHARIDPVQAMMWAGGDFAIATSAGWIDRMEADSSELAAKTKTAFDEATRRHRLPVGRKENERESPVTPSLSMGRSTSWVRSMPLPRRSAGELAASRSENRPLRSCLIAVAVTQDRRRGFRKGRCRRRYRRHQCSRRRPRSFRSRADGADRLRRAALRRRR